MKLKQELILENDSQLKKDIGNRLRQFRSTIGKSQEEFEFDTDINQATCSRIEQGKIFPIIKYLIRMKNVYQLNTDWLISGKGVMFEKKESLPDESYVSYLGCHIPPTDKRYDLYQELIDIMQLPDIDEIILAKIKLIKRGYREEIEEFKKKKKIELPVEIDKELL